MTARRQGELGVEYSLWKEGVLGLIEQAARERSAAEKRKSLRSSIEESW